MFTPEYWNPGILADPEIKDLKGVEEVLLKTPPDFIRKELRLHVNRALIQTNEFVQSLLGLRNSFRKLVRIITVLYLWRYPKHDAREKARNFLLDLAAPDPDSPEVAALAKTYEIQVVNDQIYAKTRNYVSKEGNIISTKYRVILPSLLT